MNLSIILLHFFVLICQQASSLFAELPPKWLHRTTVTGPKVKPPPEIDDAFGMKPGQAGLASTTPSSMSPGLIFLIVILVLMVLFVLLGICLLICSYFRRTQLDAAQQQQQQLLNANSAYGYQFASKGGPEFGQGKTPATQGGQTGSVAMSLKNGCAGGSSRRRVGGAGGSSRRRLVTAGAGGSQRVSLKRDGSKKGQRKPSTGKVQAEKRKRGAGGSGGGSVKRRRRPGSLASVQPGSKGGSRGGGRTVSRREKQAPGQKEPTMISRAHVKGANLRPKGGDPELYNQGLSFYKQFLKSVSSVKSVSQYFDKK